MESRLEESKCDQADLQTPKCSHAFIRSEEQLMEPRFLCGQLLRWITQQVIQKLLGASWRSCTSH